ncbi:nucleoside diphosphate kinase [Enterococcus faecalis 13-SD-W-01]|nr:nucleoside diphosphate kinase [Enterococcus faecalis 13-SD-W-01]
MIFCVYNKINKEKGVNDMERTLVIIKPDGLRRRLAGKIIQRFEEKGFSIIEMRQETMSRELAMEHYHHLVNRSFFPELISYMTSGPVVYIVLEGEEVIDLVRKMVGATKAADAAPGTIRGDYAKPGTENIIHASDSRDAAEKEIQRFFG